MERTLSIRQIPVMAASYVAASVLGSTRGPRFGVNGTRRKNMKRLAALLVLGGLAVAAAPAAASGEIDQTITNGTGLSLTSEQVTLPLYKGHSSKGDTYFVITDSSSRSDATARGIDAAPKLANALGTTAVQKVTRAPDGSWIFPGTVDFTPEHIVEPGPTGFPPAVAQPGSVGDDVYSPLVTLGNGIVYNATQVSNSSGTHDSVVAIDTVHGKVTLKTFFGFWNGHRTVYLHQDSSSMVVAAAEGSTYAPNLDAAPGLGSNDSKTSARSAIIPIVNGERGVNNPNRQGLQSALFGEGDPMNINQDVPGRGGDRYSPVWDVHAVVWTDAAIAAGKRRLLTSGSDVASAFGNGQIVSPFPGPANPSLGGFPAAGFISNCPIVAVL